MNEAEINLKLSRLGEFLDRHRLDGVLLTQRGNFAWITGGRDNHIANNTPVGVASILATRDSRLCLANAIEAPRMKHEELAGAGIGVIDFPWWDAQVAGRAAGEAIAGRTIAADSEDFGLGLPPLPEDFAELRWSLTPAEVERYREGATRASRAMEQACREVRPGQSEHEIAGVLARHIHRQGCNPIVTLIAADERIEHYRHPIPTGHRLRRYVMLITCAEFGGLIACLTRFVHFGDLPAELRRKQHAICNIDTAVNLSTRPGRTLGEIFAILQQAYADNGHPDQWKLHHQGGSTGYAGREVIATPGSAVAVLENQAFAWNPSITGVKSEDTILCTRDGVEILTAASDEWPKVEGHFAGRTLPRPDILAR